MDAVQYLKPQKGEFHLKLVTFPDMVISPEGITVEQSKVTMVQEWEASYNMKEVQTFVNFYRSFIMAYSRIVSPLTALTQKGTNFPWTKEAGAAFQALKDAFTSALILKHFDPERLIVVGTDPSDYGSAGVMSQYDDQGILHPIAFFSKKHSPPNATTRFMKRNYWPLSVASKNDAPTSNPRTTHQGTVGPPACRILHDHQATEQPPSKMV